MARKQFSIDIQLPRIVERIAGGRIAKGNIAPSSKVGNMNLSQPTTTVESILPNAGDAVAESHAGQIAATIECTIGKVAVGYSYRL